jgi:hypothetical protein
VVAPVVAAAPAAGVEDEDGASKKMVTPKLRPVPQPEVSPAEPLLAPASEAFAEFASDTRWTPAIPRSELIAPATSA